MKLIVPGLNDGDDIIWRRSVSFIDECGALCFREVTRSKDDRDRLVARLGEPWLVEYLASREAELQAVAARRVH